MIKQIDVLDIGDTNLIIRLKSEYLEYIKSRIITDGGFYKLGKTCNLDYTKIWQAFVRNSIPLYILRAVKKCLDLQDIEESVCAYKSYNGKLWVNNPNLTIEISPQLLEIFGHCIGDGFVTLEKARTSTYTNTSKMLVENFKALCETVFGELELKTYYDKRFDAETVRLPRVLSVILVEFFPEILNKRIPGFVFHLPKEIITPLIRAFADDESCVATSAIYYVQKDRTLLEEIRRLHLIVGFKEENLTPVKEKGGLYRFSIIGKGLINFYENVRYKHPNKMRDLEIEVIRKKNKKIIKTIDATAKNITDFLSTPKTVKELSAIVGTQPSIIRKHIKRLYFSGYVKVFGHSKYNVPTWIKVKDYKLVKDAREDAIKDFLRLTPLSTLELSKRMGFGKDRLLMYLHQLKKEGRVSYTAKGRTYVWCIG
ncbi:hypothetical protein HYY73_06145 [Candidatus Woesearchaeota archaeon]|nr:hypothetical protein [Candidatus Woesearchaeota archaeon]